MVGRVVKTRRSHRKSRNGCAECKRRHIRCDERRPTCTNCAIAERSCSFPPSSSSSSPCLKQTLPSFTEGFLHGDGAAAAAAAAAAEGYSHPPAPPASLFTARHLMILHHVFLSVAEDGVVAQDHVQGVLDIAIRYAVDAPYLVDQLLALSALHLAVRTGPDDACPAGTPASLRHQATELQTRAVSSFTRLTAGVRAEDKATCVPRFLFASLLSLQVLAETLHQHRRPLPSSSANVSQDAAAGTQGCQRESLDAFVQRMVECVHLHRGMLSVIRPTWNHLLQSELSPLLHISNHAANLATVKLAQGSECAPLDRLLASSSALDDSSAAACRGCIERLQWAFDMQNSLPSQDVPHAVSSFIVTLPAEFADVLATCCPEALIILAYFAVLLHRCRRFWTFEHVGANMIRAIALHLGEPWGDALGWPLKVIECEND